MASITLSMIVKNEENYLRDCLESVKDIVSEIVIVDTGSTDDTIKIASEYGAKILNFDWIDDFSAARNYALKNSSGDWILYLDADERLDEQSKEEIIRRTETVRKTGLYCIVKNIDSEESRDNSFRYVRLFARQPELEFIGKIHEQIEDSLKKNDYLLVNSKILINHIGYNVSIEKKKLKAKRNLDLLLKEYENNHSAYYEYQLAQTYNVLHDEINATKYFLKAAESPKLDRVYRAQCYASLALIAYSNHKISDAEKLVLQSLKLDDRQPFAYLLASKISFRNGDLNKAEEKCKKANDLNKALVNTLESRTLEILVDPEEIIYYGLTLAFQNRSALYLKHYQKELEEIYKIKYASDYEDYFLITKKIIQNYPLSNDEIILIEKIIKIINIQFYLYLLSNYKNNEVKIVILEHLVQSFPNSTDVKRVFVKTLEEVGRIDEAIELIESDEKIQTEDAAIMFYLISFYIKKGNIEKLNDTITNLEKNFQQIPEVAVRISALKEKLKAIIKK